MDDLTIRTGHAELIRARAATRWPSLLGAAGLRSTGPDPVRRHTFGAVDEYDRALTVRLDAVPLPGGRQVRVFANTTSDNHVIQLSDQLTPEQEERALAAGMAELLAVRRRADVGLATIQPQQNADPVYQLLADETRLKAAEAAAQRDQLSARTLGELREFASGLKPGQLPRTKLMIGGGAALAGRDPDVLVVDARGRWHVDPIAGIVQSADQVRHLAESGLGNPYDVAGPRERVPLTAIQLWEDRAAVRGPLIDGKAQLAMDGDRLVADIQPLDGSEPIRVEVDGTPVIATGVPPEIVPGASRYLPTIPEALAAIDGYLADADARTTEAGAARGFLQALRDEPGAAGAALTMLAVVPEVAELRAALHAGGIPGAHLGAAMTTLEATEAWDRARLALPGRVLIGDEIGDGHYDPAAGKHWLIAGIGGGAIANTEIILAANPEARITMVGTEAPWVLHNDAQYSVLRQLHDRDFNPEASGRLQTIPGKRLGMVGTARTEDGRSVVRMLDDHGEPVRDASGEPLEGDVYVGCLGRVARTPQAMDELRAWADEVHGELEIGDDQQYLGYRVSCRKGDAQVDIEVTGAASRMLPADLFDARTALMVDELGMVEAPPESGNVAAGFMATALQAASRARQQTRPAPDSRGR